MLARTVWPPRAVILAVYARAQAAHGRAAVGHGRVAFGARPRSLWQSCGRAGFGWVLIVRGSCAVWPGVVYHAFKLKECMAELPEGQGCRV